DMILPLFGGNAFLKFFPKMLFSFKDAADKTQMNFPPLSQEDLQGIQCQMMSFPSIDPPDQQQAQHVGFLLAVIHPPMSYIGNTIRDDRFVTYRRKRPGCCCGIRYHTQR